MNFHLYRTSPRWSKGWAHISLRQGWCSIYPSVSTKFHSIPRIFLLSNWGNSLPQVVARDAPGSWVCEPSDARKAAAVTISRFFSNCWSTSRAAFTTLWSAESEWWRHSSNIWPKFKKKLVIGSKIPQKRWTTWTIRSKGTKFELGTVFEGVASVISLKSLGSVGNNGNSNFRVRRVPVTTGVGAGWLSSESFIWSAKKMNSLMQIIPNGVMV